MSRSIRSLTFTELSDDDSTRAVASPSQFSFRVTATASQTSTNAPFPWERLWYDPAIPESRSMHSSSTEPSDDDSTRAVASPTQFSFRGMASQSNVNAPFPWEFLCYDPDIPELMPYPTMMPRSYLAASDAHPFLFPLAMMSPVSNDFMSTADDENEVVLQDVLSPDTVLKRRFQDAQAKGLVIEIQDDESDNENHDDKKMNAKQPAVTLNDEQVKPVALTHSKRLSKTVIKAPASPVAELTGSLLRFGLRRSARLNKKNT